ncbi:LIM-type zinc finger-containing protein [Tieghemostelium lacteum]|uniref:Kinetochore protein NDC80 n=1 Tax=Tieghemostelium lacteum TaxID=361077 RepID=A0A152A4N3_TIELA|nr:LIM-type zinc finger-containing protein [Tieghemostelium lacteum]|eukprot:KYR01196.1 LIM-type zinc finger-containing protein [Tieghemostelium lacteum]
MNNRPLSQINPNLPPRVSITGRKSISQPNNNRQSMGTSLFGNSIGTSNNGSIRNTINPVQSRVSTAVGNNKPGTGRSISLSIKPPTTKTETRPINDKNFQQQCILKLTHYLANEKRPYPSQISKKSLLSPSAKEFFSIVEFLAIQYDPNFKMSAKPDEDIVNFFKQVRYPFNISKSALSAVGSPHTWPVLLAALVWLVEILEMSEAESELDPNWEQLSGDVLDQDLEERCFYSQYVIKSYETYLSGDDLAMVESQLEMRFDEKENRLTDYIDASEQRQKQLKEESDQLNRYLQEPDLQELQKKKEMINEDLNKFSKLINELELHKLQYEKRIAARQQELENRELEHQNLIEKKKQLEGIILDQQSKLVDGKKMDRDRTQLKDDISKVQTEKSRTEKQKSSLITGIQTSISAIEDQIQQYNEVCRRIQPVFDEAKLKKSDYQIDFHCLQDTERIHFSDRKPISKNFKSLMDGFTVKNQQLQEEMTRQAVELKKILEQITDKTQQAKIIEQRLNTLELNLQREKEKHAKELQQLEKKVETLQKTNRKLKEDTKSYLENSHRSLDSYQEEYDQIQSQLSKQHEIIKNQMIQNVEKILSHQAYVQDIISSLHETIKVPDFNLYK